MSCTGCSTGKNSDGTPKGCNSNGGCSTGGCNKLNTYDWLTKLDLPDTNDFGFVEVSFKNGARKAFFQNTPYTHAITGDMVVVESGAGLDIGKISLSGDLVRLQMKKKRVTEDVVTLKIVRIANDRDLERLYEARAKEPQLMVRARVIARSLDLDMKIGDVEFQGDKRKVTIFYTADGRIDFRELIRQFAKEFRVKIEMRQIGARQESARIGGIGSCGRELCCSTWLTDFRSVSTAAARYQNLAINQTKLSGQCGRLKCCLNYELDTYMDALEEFPKKVDALFTQAGKAVLVKTDIFKRTMYFAYLNDGGSRGKFFGLPIERVKEIVEMNKNGEKPTELLSDEIRFGAMEDALAVSTEFGDDEGLTGVIELPPEQRKRKSRSKSRKPQNRPNRGKSNQQGRDTPQGNSNARPTAKANNPNQKPNQNPNQKPNPNQNPNQNKPKQGQPKGKPSDGADVGRNKPKPKTNPNQNRNKNRRNNSRNNPNPNPNKNPNPNPKRNSDSKGNNDDKSKSDNK
jgi:cell fate regulator YaaT (PSP1 superfamily)